MAKAYRNTSSGALCMVTATIPIIIKIVEIVKLYSTKNMKSKGLVELDHEVEYEYWPHQADLFEIIIGKYKHTYEHKYIPK